ncbi:MAG: RIP metalloprotease RseP [Chitinophagaceae bacterium]
MAQWQVKGLQLFAALSLLIILHELGHFVFARLFKTRVEKFYLFFDFLFPFGNVLNFSLFKKTKGDTTYGIGWFPLGGYVKIAGMVDESMDKDQLALPPQPWEYRSKKAWQRTLIMLGGIIVNVLVAIIIYVGIFKYWGESYLPLQEMKYGIQVDSVGYKLGLRNGDMIMALDGKPVSKMNEVTKGILLHNAKTIQVKRGGVITDVTVPSGTIRSMVKAKSLFATPIIPMVVDSCSSGSFGYSIGLRNGDTIRKLNGEPFADISKFNEKKQHLAGQPVVLTVVHAGGDTALLSGVLPKDKVFGFRTVSPEQLFHFKDVEYSMGAAIARGVRFTGEQFVDYWYQLKLLFTSKEIKASESVGGIGTFASQFPGEFDWHAFWMFTAFISIILAFMNLLPIPGLDGGYVIFLIWEMITGRKVSDKVMEVATTIGLVLLLGLMLYANGMDIVKALR